MIQDEPGYMPSDESPKDSILICTRHSKTSKKKPPVLYWNSGGWAKMSPRRFTQAQANRLLKNKHMEKQPTGYLKPKIVEYDEQL